MKIALKNFKNGKVSLEDAPIPNISENEILIKNIFSVISPGTERMLLDFGNQICFQKLLSNPKELNRF